jgi:hypothetical protein
MYDSRLGRWLSVDPLAQKYSFASPYCYVLNTPIQAIDPDGKRIIFIIRDEKGNITKRFLYKNGEFYNMQTGKQYDKVRGANNTMFRLVKAYNIIEQSNDEVLKNQLHTLEDSDLDHFIEKGKENQVVPFGLPKGPKKGSPTGTQTTLNFSEEAKKDFQETEGVENSDLSIVTHEMRHQYDDEIGNSKDNHGFNSAKDPSEIRAVNNENRGRKMQGLSKRTTYGGEKIDPKKLDNPPNNLNPTSNDKK